MPNDATVLVNCCIDAIKLDNNHWYSDPAAFTFWNFGHLCHYSDFLFIVTDSCFLMLIDSDWCWMMLIDAVEASSNIRSYTSLSIPPYTGRSFFQGLFVSLVIWFQLQWFVLIVTTCVCCDTAFVLCWSIKVKMKNLVVGIWGQTLREIPIKLLSGGAIRLRINI